jgi:osmoprotectant transport system ATP-binding protein
VIKFESVSKTFRDGTTAVADLSLTAPSGEITVIVGPSGCGKTTTLRMVNRMLEPTSGRIVWDGTPLKSRRKTTLRRQMGYVIQSGGLFPHRTVLENIGTVPGLLRWSKDKTQQRSMELLGSVGLDRKLANRYPAQLSGGQQQRVGVARALAADPQVLLMDEPFSAVDPVVRSELHDFFLGLQREISKTIILITHDIDEAIKLGDQVAILRVGGRLAQVGTPQHLLDEPADDFVEGFVGKDRGYRSLSFLPAGNLELEKVKVVRDVETAATGEPTLVVDGEARPVGWANADRPGQVFPLGSVFDPESDTLRTALDSALTSLYGLAVAVDPETGRFAGVVAARRILDQVAGARLAVAESISVRDADRAMTRTMPQSLPDDKSKPAEPADTAEGREAKLDERKPEGKTDSPESVGEPPSDDRPVPGGDSPGAGKSTARAEAEPEVATEAEPTKTEASVDADQEAKIVTVVSGQPVDLGKADAAPSPDQAKGAPTDRAPERDPVR